MTVTFISNFLNHHQTPFCNEMYKVFGNEFKFISTIQTPEWILNSGYSNFECVPYNLLAFKCDDNYREALRLSLQSDIVVHGAAPENFIKERLELNKVTFRYSERIFKNGLFRILDPRVLYKLIRNHTINRKKKLYMLCASAYVANDLDFICAYPNKKFKWGYFTEVEKLNIEQIIQKRPKNRVELLWTARFISWKHPELAVKLAFELKIKGYNFHLNMIGTGEMFDSIKLKIFNLGLTDCITLLGNLTNKEVRNYMLNSNIFLFTSDKVEGWGAVLNEAMSSGCAVVVSHKIGSVPFLIENNHNGIIFQSENLADLINKVEYLINNEEKRYTYSINAYNTIVNLWSPKQAAINFINLSDSLINNKSIEIEIGPCSKAIYTSIKL
jgi:glycosyltransferase involved in cell wall biosynthesis